jgi:hypothetical protein
MSITKINNSILPEINNLQSKWDEGIIDAKEKIKKLRMTIRVYEASKKSGDKWPGDAETQN